MRIHLSMLAVSIALVASSAVAKGATELSLTNAPAARGEAWRHKPTRLRHLCGLPNAVARWEDVSALGLLAAFRAWARQESHQHIQEWVQGIQDSLRDIQDSLRDIRELPLK